MLNGAAGNPVPRVHPLVLPSGIQQLSTARESPHSSGAPLGFFSASAVEHLGAPQLGLQADAGVLGGPSARGSTPVARKVRTDKEARTRPYNKTRCPHGRDHYSCRDCGGAGICEHKRRKSQVCILPFVNILVGVTRLWCRCGLTLSLGLGDTAVPRLRGQERVPAQSRAELLQRMWRGRAMPAQSRPQQV